MATEFYKLPTINNEADTVSYCDAVNGLATSADQTLEDMRLEFTSNPYQLPAATKGSLGGVRIGDGWLAYSDGEITPKDSKYVLPAANKDTLGGIKAGQNIGITDKGAINVEAGAYNLDNFGTAQIRDLAVTTEKLKTLSVDTDNAATEIPTILQTVYNQYKNPTNYYYRIGPSSYNGVGTLVVSIWGGFARLFIVNLQVQTTRTAGDYDIFIDSATTTKELAAVLPNHSKVTVPICFCNRVNGGLKQSVYCDIYPQENKATLKIDTSATTKDGWAKYRNQTSDLSFGITTLSLKG